MSNFSASECIPDSNIVRPFQSQPPARGKDGSRTTPIQGNGVPFSTGIAGLPNKNVEPSKGVQLVPSCPNKKSADSECGVIHSKLQADLNNIRMWKINVDQELKQKTQYIESLNQIVESQRKSILDLQLENEKLSLRINDELDTKGELEKRLRSTRELLFVVKEHMGKIEEKISDCRNLKVMFDELNNERANDFDSLTLKFQNLAVTYSENVKELNNQISEKDNERNKMHTTYETQVTKLNQVLSSLESSNSSKDSHIKDLETQLSDYKAQKSDLEIATHESKMKIEALGNEILSHRRAQKKNELHTEGLNSNLLEVKSALEEAKFQIVESCLTNTTLKTEISILEEQLINNRNQLESEKGALLEQLSVANKKLESCETDLKESGNTIESLKSSSDCLKMTVTDLRNQNRKLQSDFDSCNNERAVFFSQIAQLKSSLEESTVKFLKLQDAEKQLYETREQLEAKIKLLSTLKFDLENTLEEVKFQKEYASALNEKVNFLDVEIAKRDATIKTAESDISVLSERNQNLADELASLYKRDTSATESMENVKNLMDTTVKDLQEKLDQANLEKGRNQDYIEKVECMFDSITLSDDKEKTEAFKSVAGLDNKVHFLSKYLENLSHKIQELETNNISLEKELNLKSKLTDKPTDEISYLNRKLEENASNYRSLENHVKILEQQLVDLRKINEEITNELREAKIAYDSISRLEKDNTNLYIDTDRELQDTQNRLARVERELKYHKYKNKDFEKKKSELDDLKNKYCALQKEIEDNESSWAQERKHLISEASSIQRSKNRSDVDDKNAELKTPIVSQTELNVPSPSTRNKRLYNYQNDTLRNKTNPSTKETTDLTVNTTTSNQSSFQTLKYDNKENRQPLTQYSQNTQNREYSFFGTTQSLPDHKGRHHTDCTADVLRNFNTKKSSMTPSRKTVLERTSSGSVKTPMHKSSASNELKRDQHANLNGAQKKSVSFSPQYNVFEFDSDTSSGSGINLGVSQVLKLLENSSSLRKNQQTLPIRRSAQQNTNASTTKKTNLSTALKTRGIKSSDRKDHTNDLGIFSKHSDYESSSSKKQKMSPPMARVQRKFFKKEAKEKMITEKNYLNDNTVYELFAED